MSERPKAEDTKAEDTKPEDPTSGAKASRFGETFDRVFENELACIRQRWQTVHGKERPKVRPESKATENERDAPTVDNNLVGLAFSGGGIRSATINLGITQALHRRGVFDHVDYMSSVSGGGYLASSISTAMREWPEDPGAPKDKGEFPYAYQEPEAQAGAAVGEPREVETKFLTWVRNNSNYLTVGGLLAWPRIVGSLLRGILANFLVVVPILLVLAVGLVWVHGGRLARWDAADYELSVAAKTAAAAKTRAERIDGLAAGGDQSAWAQADEAKEEAEGAARRERELAAKAPKLVTFFRVALAIAGIFVLVVFIFPVFIRVYKVYRRGAKDESTVEDRGNVEKAFGLLLLLIVVIGVAEAMPLLIRWFHKLEAGGLRGLYAGAGSGGALVIFTTAGQLLSKLGGLRQKIVLLLVGLLGLLIPLVVTLYVADDLIYFHPKHQTVDATAKRQPPADEAKDTRQAEADARKVETLALDGRPQYVTISHQPMELSKPLEDLGFVRMLTGVLLIILGGGAAAAAVGMLRASKLRSVLTFVAIPVGAFVGYAILVGSSRAPAYLSAKLGFTVPEVRPDFLVLALAAVVFLFCWLAIEINVTGMLGFYRDRLARAYLIGVRKKLDKDDELTAEDEIFVEPDLNLEELCGGTPARLKGEEEDGVAIDAVCCRRSKAPYHLVNTTLNLQGSKDPMLRDRQSDFFMFSKLYYGGHRTGYCETWRLEKVFPQMDLPTAMAISAAAASPNSGRATNKPLVALMTLLNVRLGYWVPHPGRLYDWLEERNISVPELRHRWRWRVPPWALLREMISAVNEEDKWVNLSDGGHTENLAIYELLRRRCRFIICGDGAADPALTFGNLATLMRSARIDMGIEIEILLDDLRLSENGTSHQHAALGKIKYPPLEQGDQPEVGHLLFLKSSFTGNEDETMQEYRAKSPTFPHESTADQFFSEGQFEAYRALGFHMADGLFPPREPRERKMDWDDFTDWFERLEADLAPRLSAKHTALQAQLRKIQEVLQRPQFHDYFMELRGYDVERPAGEGGEPPEQTPLPEIMYLVGLQMSLMEDAFISLNLDQPRNWNHEGNRGWRNLFEAWARSPIFNTGYMLNIDRHSGRFKNFCERFLFRDTTREAMAGAS